jgi:NADPH:quinone reductase-like Zn-dependent oxidoreductase
VKSGIQPYAQANKENNFKNFLLKSVDADLAELVGMVKAGKLKLPVDSVMDFKDTPAALTKSLTQQGAGKIVIKINP